MLENLKTVDLRKLAGSMGIKGQSSARKEQLIPIITAAIEFDHEVALRENAERAPKAPAKPKGKRCEICGIRPIGSPNKNSYGDRAQAKAMGYCTPCLTEAEWDNVHSDDDHENLTEKVDGCWTCYPEANEANADYVAPKGVSRVGQKLHVSLRATGETKADETIAQLPVGTWTEMKTTERGTFLIIKLAEKTMTLGWDAAGRYSYAASTVAKIGGKSRKVRNVSEALRIAANG